MERVVVLAGSLREANAYCREKGIRATFAKTSAQIQRATTIIGLPGFDRRRDRFALLNSAEARMKYGKGVEYVDATDWVAPKPQKADEPDSYGDLTVESLLVNQLDLTDETVLDELKVALNAVGLTLKKLPKQKTDAAEAPVVDAPVEF